MQQLAEVQRRQRRLLGGLEHDRAAAGERRPELPRRHQQREVPGDDLADDADRLAQRVGEVLAGRGDRRRRRRGSSSASPPCSGTCRRPAARRRRARRRPACRCRATRASRARPRAPRSGRRSARSACRARTASSAATATRSRTPAAPRSTARSTSSASPCATSASFSSVAGLIVSNVSPGRGLDPLAVDQELPGVGDELLDAPPRGIGLLLYSHGCPFMKREEWSGTTLVAARRLSRLRELRVKPDRGMRRPS